MLYFRETDKTLYLAGLSKPVLCQLYSETNQETDKMQVMFIALLFNK